MNPWYDMKIKKRWTFNKWNWLWLWIFPTYVAFGEGANKPYARGIYGLGDQRNRPDAV